MKKAIAVRVHAPYVLDVTFNDGSTRTIDMASELDGPVFAPLRDPALFAQAALDPACGSVFWPTGADLAPEFLVYGADGLPPGFYGEEPAEESAGQQTGQR